MYYNPYEILIKNGIFYVPPIKLVQSSGDEIVFWSKESSRLDLLSQQYYGNPYGGFLILLANGKSTETEFIDNEKVVIPMSYKNRVEEYIDKVNQYINNNF